MKILADHRWCGDHGIGRYAKEILSAIPTLALDSKGSPSSPFDMIYLNAQLKKVQPDLFYSPGYNAPLSFGKKGIPYIFTVHDLMHREVPEERKLLTTIYYEIFLKSALRKAYKVMTVSEHSKSRIMEFSGIDAQKIVITSNGVDTALFSPSSLEPQFPVKKPYFLYVGNHRPHKNLDRLLQAFALFLNKNGSADFDLLLTGTENATLRQLSKELKISDRLIFLGKLSDESLVQYYRRAQALMIPSTHEGFGLPALEALACGTLVVASHTCSLPEVVGNQGIFIDPFNIESMVFGLEKTLESHFHTPEKVNERVLYAKGFSWDKVVNRVQTVFSEFEKHH